MIILGLTGSIGMGKTTAANQLRKMGVPVHDADDVVHKLTGKGGKAVPLVGDAFPGVVFGGTVDRGRLGARVFSDDRALHRLEAILHPLVHDEERAFLRRCRNQRKKVVALDIPLLFEVKGEDRVDAIAVVSCPKFLQEQRVMKRRGMTHGKLKAIRQRQLPDSEKRRHAHFVIPTGAGRRASLIALRRAMTVLKAHKPRR